MSTIPNSSGKPLSVLLIGCGDIGQRVASKLLAAEQAVKISALRRNPVGLGSAITPLKADVTDLASLQKLPQTEFDYIITTLTPGRFDEQAYQQVYYQGLENILEVFTATKHFFWVSSTSVYGQTDGEWVDENSETSPGGFSGKVLLSAEKLLSSRLKNSSSIRFAGIYGPGRQRLLNKVRSGVVENSPAFSNRIHVDDCAAMLVFLLQQSVQGKLIEPLYIGVDDNPCPLNEVYQWLAGKLGIDLQLSQSGSKRSGSKRCSNKKIRSEGFEFSYPDYRSGYVAMLDKPTGKN